MRRSKRHRKVELESALVDAAVDSYADWREQSAAVPARVSPVERAGNVHAAVIAYYLNVALDPRRLRPRGIDW